MRKILYSLIIGVISVGIGVCQAEAPAKAPAQNAGPVEPLNRIVAVVNDEIITQSELDQAVEQVKQQLIATNTPVPSAEKLRSDALEQLILLKLEIQMATRTNVHVASAEIDAAIEQIAKSHNLTVDQLQAQFAEQHTNYADFRKRIGDQLIINKLQQQMVAATLKVTDAEIAAYKNSNPGAEEYHIADFFFPVSDQPTPEELDRALTQAHEVEQQLAGGTPANQVIPAYQDLGWRTKTDLPQLFAEQVPSLQSQKHSLPLRAPNGYHVLALIESRNTNQKLTDDQVRQILLQQKFAAAVKDALNKARQEAYVQIIPQ